MLVCLSVCVMSIPYAIFVQYTGLLLDGGEIWWGSMVLKYGGKVWREVWRESMAGKYGGEVW